MDTVLNQKEQQPLNGGLQISPSETVPLLSKELTENGVKPVSAEVELTKEHRVVGIMPAGAAVPVWLKPEGIVSLPEQEEISLSLKMKFNEAGRWWAEFFERQLKKLGLQKRQEVYAG